MRDVRAEHVKANTLAASEPVVAGSKLKGGIRKFLLKTRIDATLIVEIEASSMNLEKRISELKMLSERFNSTKYRNSKDIKPKKSKIYLPPGSSVRSVLEFIFSKKAFDGVFAQVIVDMREEHAEALAVGELRKARWIVVRGHLGIGLTVMSYLGATLGKRLAGIWQMIP